MSLPASASYLYARTWSRPRSQTKTNLPSGESVTQWAWGPDWRSAVHAVAGVLDEVGGRAELAILGDGKHGNAAAAVVGDNHMATDWVEREMARAAAARGLLVDERQLEGPRIDGECADRAAGLAVELVDLVDGKEEATLGVDREERRARRFGGEAERFEKQILRDVKVLGLQAEEVDALALAAGVRANVGERVGGPGGRGLLGSTAAAACGKEQEGQDKKPRGVFEADARQGCALPGATLLAKSAAMPVGVLLIVMAARGESRSQATGALRSRPTNDAMCRERPARRSAAARAKSAREPSLARRPPDGCRTVVATA